MTTLKKDKRKLTIIAFGLNLILCANTFLITLKSYDNNIFWKKIVSTTGFIVFLTVTILLFIKIIKNGYLNKYK